MKRYSKERDAGRVAVHLAQFYFFGESVMARTTAAHLDPAKMGQIKSGFGEVWGEAVIGGQGGAMEKMQDGHWPKVQGSPSKDSVVMARAFAEL